MYLTIFYINGHFLELIGATKISPNLASAKTYLSKVSTFEILAQYAVVGLFEVLK